MIPYISSTQIRTFMACPRKWAFQYVERAKSPKPSRAMAFGTLVHACLEFRVLYGKLPTKKQMSRMKGNYDDPVVSMNLYPDEVERAMACAATIDVDAILPDSSVRVVEQAIGDFGLTLAGVPLQGYIDLWDGENTIIDWKTRSSFKYAPQTDADFRANYQLCLYAAALQRYFDFDHVIVRHVNINSKDFSVLDVSSRLDAWYLKGVWTFFDEILVPKMLETAAASIRERERNTASCYMYRSQCPFFHQCPGDGAQELRELLMQVNSEQAHPNIEPTPFREKSIEEMQTHRFVNSRQLETLMTEGVLTLGQLADLVDAGFDFTELDGFGAKSAKKLVEGLKEFPR